jgi:hypothetical protein
MNLADVCSNRALWAIKNRLGRRGGIVDSTFYVFLNALQSNGKNIERLYVAAFSK